MAVVSLADAVQAATPGLPILFVDTCSLLEILRFGKRARNNLQSDLGAATRARGRQTAAPPSLLVVTSDLVGVEWARNEQGVLTEVEDHVRNVQANTARIVDCGTYLGQVIAPPLDLAPLGVPAALHALAADLLADSKEIARSQPIEGAAFARQLAVKGPASRGKDCLGDCVVAETLLAFAAAVPMASRGRLVFLTYNTKDFTNGAAMPHVDLAADFTRLRIELVTDWGWAAHSLGI